MISVNFRKSVVGKKALRYSAAAYRPFFTDNSRPRNPVIANSFPKSGTHLIIQILEPLPKLRDWGYFLPSSPSFSLKERCGGTMASRISVMANNELAGAHLYYSEAAEEALAKLNAVHYFIYRDLRDVALSESYYLYCMNKWHRLHSVYKNMHDEKDRLRFAIEGDRAGLLPCDYDDIGTRFRKYMLWISKPEVFAIKFEDLIGPEQEKHIRAMVEHHWSATGQQYDLETYQQRAIENVNPERSHTFRTGKKGKWEQSFDDELRSIFKQYAGQLMIDLGYEHDLNW